MSREEYLWKILKERYGITTMEELDEAIANLPLLDIGVFVCPLGGKDGDNGNSGDDRVGRETVSA